MTHGRTFGRAWWLAVFLAGAKCGEEDTAPDDTPGPFDPPVECNGAQVVPFQGDRQMVLSSVVIASEAEALDLNRDGKKDNQLALVGAIANAELVKSFTSTHDVLVPLELFGYAGESDTSCTKLAVYAGLYNTDRDGDGRETTWNKGDCMDGDPAVRPGVPEDLTNRLDDDCDGLADNMMAGSPPMDTTDLDGDGVSLMGGDCDDRNDAGNLALAKSRNPQAIDTCGDGIDQNCDGIADNDPSCDPFAANNSTIYVDPSSIAPSGLPEKFFRNGRVVQGEYVGGPDQFSATLPIDESTIALRLDGATIRMNLSDDTDEKKTTGIQGTLGGVIQAKTLSELNVRGTGIIPDEQTLLDAVFVGPLGPLLGLDQDEDQHYLPDIDFDGDGIETFWAENAAMPAKVDTCKDGDGTIFRGADCALATDAQGRYRFVDGLSVALKVKAVPAKLRPLSERQ